ncbi:MAG: DNA repair and recombination protein RadA [Candidatus Heimdallarchaeota archaeon]|nr:DNA repair and recombination protein RadA [Candidatus Heimdallarchaeota archaeon]
MDIDTGKSPISIPLTDVPGLGAKSAQILTEAGISNPAALMDASLSELEIAGLTRTMSKKLREGVISLFPHIYGDFAEEQSLEDIEGIGPTTAKSLREKGMNIHLLETTPVKELEERFGITQNSAVKYQSAIAESKGGYFQTALTVMEKQRISNTFTFGAESLDNLFFIPELAKSGIREGETYEFFGSFRSGKSQLCHQLCVTVQLPRELGGLGKKAIYIDTEGTFSPTRIMQMAKNIKEEKGWDKPVNEILGDIMYARAKNTDMQQGIAIKLLEILGENSNEFGMVVVDSVTAHFRAEYAGRGTLADRQQTLNHHLSILHRIADTYNLAIVVTNQVQANPAQFFGDPTTAVGGNIMAHWAQTRCYLRKSKGEKRVIRVFDSPVLGENEAVFEITGEGVLSSE